MRVAPLFTDTRLLDIHSRLLARYGQPAERDVWDPLKQFIYSLLSSRTKTEVTHEVVRHLQAMFGPWESLRDASITEIEDAIRAITFPEQKAVHLTRALEQITQRYGKLSLDFLKSYRTAKIRSWLEPLRRRRVKDKRSDSELQHVTTTRDLCRQSPPACDTATGHRWQERGCARDGKSIDGDGARCLVCWNAR